MDPYDDFGGGDLGGGGADVVFPKEDKSSPIRKKRYDVDEVNKLKKWSYATEHSKLLYKSERDKELVNVYKLVTEKDDLYDYRISGVEDGLNKIKLKAGSLYRYGVEKVGTERYTNGDLKKGYGNPVEKIKLTQTPMTRLEAELLQKAYIITYIIQHGGNLPPGNKNIF